MKSNRTIDSISAELARFALETGAFRLTPNNPVRWASGYRMPVYTDNRLLLRTPRGRDLVRTGLRARLREEGEHPWDAVAGTASAGIAPAVLLAEELATGFLYVRSGAKEHGLQRQIEGLSPDEIKSELPLAGRTVLLVEDLLSTGGSSAAAARTLMEAGATVPLCLALFSYGFTAVADTFTRLPGPCRPAAVVTLDDLLKEAVAMGALDESEQAMIEAWRDAPFTWSTI